MSQAACSDKDFQFHELREELRMPIKSVVINALPLIDKINSFRNEYVAHQDRELSDQEITKQALTQWTSGLYKIWSCG